MKKLSEALNRLKLALTAEKAQADFQESECEVLTEKMSKFQEGDGDAPSDEEFQRWRNSVEFVVKTRRLKSGLSDSEANATYPRKP